MAKYKLQLFKIYGEDSYSILDTELNCSIPKDPNNTDYQKFLQDVKTIGIAACVEGPTVGVTTAYMDARRVEYPSIEDQLDKIYHSGVNAWKADIKAIKDKYPKSQVGVTAVGAVPDWVQTELNDLLKKEYLIAIEILKKPRLADGEKVLIADNYWDPEQRITIEGKKYVYINVPDPDDPLVVSDEVNRNAAQATIDRTPQSIIDSINT